MINRLSRSMAYRWKRYRLGLWSPWRSLPKEHITIAGQSRVLRFPEGEEEIQGHELSLILIDDCYRLSDIKQPIKTVVDVGGNIGLFSLAAWNQFHPDTIHTYEPNPNIFPVLEGNVAKSCITVFPEAVGAQAGTLEMTLQENSLHTTSSTVSSQETISVPVISFSQMIDRLDVSIDLLKLDCEGAEWEMLDNASLWSGIQNLTMEYHLWARAEATVEDLVSRLEELGFRIPFVKESAETFGLLLATRD